MNKHQNHSTKKRLAVLLVGLTMFAPQAGSLPEVLQNTSFGTATAQAQPRYRDNDRDRDRNRNRDRDRNRNRDRDDWDRDSSRNRETVRGEVLGDGNGNTFPVRIDGRNFNAVARNGKPSNLRRGRDVEMSGYWHNGAFYADRISIRGGGDRNDRDWRYRR